MMQAILYLILERLKFTGVMEKEMVVEEKRKMKGRRKKDVKAEHRVNDGEQKQKMKWL